MVATHIKLFFALKERRRFEKMSMEWFTTASATIVDIMEGLLTTITGNPLLALLFASSTIIPLGLKLLKKFKKA